MAGSRVTLILGLGLARIAARSRNFAGLELTVFIDEWLRLLPEFETAVGSAPQTVDGAPDRHRFVAAAVEATDECIVLGPPWLRRSVIVNR
jgi:hypothetical protein